MTANLRRLTILLFVLNSTAPFLSAQTPAPTKPEEVGLSSDRLSRIDKLVKDCVSSNRVAGAVTLVARRGRVAHLAAAGMQDIQSGTPMRPDSIFRIASMSKPITSLAVMMLYEEGLFLLEDPVSKYIPEFKDAQVLATEPASQPYKLVAAKRPITIRHLLTHTSGISYRFQGKPYLADIYRDAGISDGLTQTEGTIGEMVKRLAKLPLLHQPGEAFEYGLSTDVLGYLVEVLSGMSLDEFFQRRIFKPLRMNDTCFFVAPEKLPRLASVYRPKPEGGIEKLPDSPIEAGHLVYSSTYQYSGPRTHFSGGAGLLSTIIDYARFLQMMLNGGELDGERLLSRTTVELMTTNHISPDLGNGYGFGFGFGVHLDRAKSASITSVGEYNWGGFFNTRFWVDPKEKMIGLVMTQMYPKGDLDLAEKCGVLAYQAIID
jgi:CubicO group peptidase (beta-lactamase class C family)